MPHANTRFPGGDKCPILWAIFPLRSSCRQDTLRALLQFNVSFAGFGVGNASASATHALLLTVLQDFFGRMTTICGAYLIGPSLTSEAKTFRLLADLLNDIAIVLDTLSPLLKLSVLRVSTLCLSGSLRAMCGLCAGGSKAALTNHFASPTSGSGDVGDLNAKDSSKETVLALLGMLVGSVVVQHLNSAFLTYTVLFTLVGLHLALNYAGVSGVVLRTLNRQRMTIAWELYRANGRTPTPEEVSSLEHIFQRPDHIRGTKCTFGSSLNAVLGGTSIPRSLLDGMGEERYILWSERGAGVSLHICFKEGYTPFDQLRSWAHAVEVVGMTSKDPADDKLILSAHQTMAAAFPAFLDGMREKGWIVADVALQAGQPQALIVAVDFEDRKRR
ncbi:unnamed protein product [Mycena citricolor]|uniref:DUF647-domain-containing protein n=1 Tax=Mycena citricolor TaxID=2018698 RepID=A0AAD2JX73_9AGAR|nr:unnamed protein product [Mycena citricolor]